MLQTLLAWVLSIAAVLSPLTPAASGFAPSGYLAGDINGDFALTAQDATLLLRDLAGYCGPERDSAVCDANGDGTVDTRDVTSIMRALAGWQTDGGAGDPYADIVLGNAWGRIQYSVIYGAHQEDAAFAGEPTFAGDFYRYIRYELGINGPSLKDDRTAPAEYEIVIGKTEREELLDFPIRRDLLGDEGFVIFQYGKRIFIAGGTDEGTRKGATYFLETVILPYMETRISGYQPEMLLAGDYYVCKPQTYNVGKVTVAGTDLSRFTIVYDADGSVSEVTAANELQHYLYRATGQKLPVVSDETAETKYEILIGQTNRTGDDLDTGDRARFGDDGLLIKQAGTKLILTGGQKRGTLYAVYTFLEEYIGYGWYETYISYLPEQALVEIPADFRDEQISPYSGLRNAYWDCALDKDFVDGYNVKNHMINDNRLTPAEYGGPKDMQGGHSMSSWYYPGDTDGIICLTDPEVLSTVLENVDRYMSQYPSTEIISVSQDDHANYCRCDRCYEMVGQYGNTRAGIQIWFINQVARYLQENYPGVEVHTFAYMYTEAPPLGIVCEENVVVQLCPLYTCKAHSLAEDCFGTEQEYYYTNFNFQYRLDGWSAICNDLFIWDYVTNFSYPMTPMMNFRQIREDIRIYAEHGATGMFTQGFTGRPVGEFGDMRAYFTAKVMWDPYISTEELTAEMHDFMAYFYGAGYTYIGESMKLLAELSAGGEWWHWGCSTAASDIYRMDEVYAHIDELNALWDAAEEAADDLRTLQNVRQSRLCVDYIVLCARWAALEECEISDEVAHAYYMEGLALCNRARAYNVISESYSVSPTAPFETWF